MPATPCQHRRRPPVLEAEPLPAVGGHVAGAGRVRGVEGRVGEMPGQQRCELDQVAPVRTHAVQQHHQLAWRPAGTRRHRRAAELHHRFNPQ